MSRPRLGKRLALGAALGVVALTASTGARAQEVGGVGGYNLLARANPLQITYDSPGLLPVSPIIQASVPEALATLTTGPTGYSLSSLAFPGPLIADLGSVLTQTDPSCQPPFPVPIYPLRSEAFFPQGPTDTDASPVPGSRMRATANGAASSAFGALDDLAMPAVFSVGSITGSSTTSGTGETAVTTARSVVSGFSMLAGAITIDSIVTDIKASSTGEAGAKTKTEGSTRVAGATVGGQRVTIDENGVTLAGSALGGVGDLLRNLGPTLNEALVQSGITIKVINHQDNSEDGLAERIAGGLVIDLNYNGRTTPLISQLLAAIPTNQLPADNVTQCAPSSPQGLVNLFKETHIISFALGGATVSTNATSAFGDALPDIGIDVGGVDDIGGAGFDDTFPGADLSATGSGSSGGSQVGGSSFNNVQPAGVVGGRGVPAALVLLALAMFPVMGTLAQRFADGALAAPVAASCPLDSEGEPDG